MSDHLNLERISALLDEPWADLDAEAHLEACELCRTEYERLSRMRMAVSALGELDPSEESWEKIQARLDGVGLPGRAAPSRHRVVRWASSWPLQAAAAAALFVGGLFAGLQLTGGGPAAADRTAARGGSPDAPSGVPAALPRFSGDAEILEALAELEALRYPVRQAGGTRALDAGLDPLAATRWIAGLDGAIRAMQERLERSPGDPVVNAYLFQMMEERNRVAGRLERAVHETQAVEW